ncbi:beta-ribofuranosylaminobenzene 5'-phosphate synthase family protein [Staphylothermus hellenicus]|uniref:Beta-ribofuranosylaminobenzene 5'-phosphate synthase n=1 Tax=Staphylothermus hellenicus (strain DSM 12710 / JCM 10830 / BK20S6-10-b1 / P8) TaxID=591019 RepID=D7D9M0_STAHD|nr:beta-ribofuranosylaminobenzene 5'-phosphate synthase family protein [Staphylothermus hellenicus]ADI32466.1 beta-ribofuranosylaminobenzene 5'-phosphate synthase family [Staphylothermus hellenicus DSM 12710]
MPISILITTGARLHLGFYNFLSEGKAYGSIGVYLKTPTIRVLGIREGDNLRIHNYTGINIDDIVYTINNIFKNYGVSIHILESFPRHVGLGSTTQILLAIGDCIRRIYNLRLSIRELALLFKRGIVSGIGIATYEKGGLIIDSGRRAKNGIIGIPKDLDDLPSVIYRKNLPQHWYFIVITPKGIKGLDEKSETPFLEKPEENKELQYELLKILVLKLLPSISNNDPKTFGRAIYKIQLLTGKYFSKYQDSIFCCEEAEYIINSLMRNGVYGAGQSSWGPTVYGIIDYRKKALRTLSRVKQELYHRDIEADYYISQVSNTGARVSRIRDYKF